MTHTKEQEEQNLAMLAWQIVRDEGWRALLGKSVNRGLNLLSTFLPSKFNCMEEVTKWLSENTYYDTYSFDMFDTLLRRRIDPPELIKYLVAEYMSAILASREISASTTKILSIRSKAERLLQTKSRLEGKDAVSRLDDIIGETLKALGASNLLDSQKFVDYELELEMKATEPMPGASSALNYLRSHGKRVICVSETYLSLQQIARMLEYHGLLGFIDKLYVSSEIGLSKMTGQLFRYVISQEENRFLHIGDDYVFDNRVPGKLGIKTLRFRSRGELIRKKGLRRLQNSNNKMDYVNAVVMHGDEKSSNALYRLGYHVLGPALTVFVHNATEQARKENAEAVFFIARDGYVLKKIYEILDNSIYGKNRLPPSKYMCQSRLSVRLASLERFDASYIDIYLAQAQEKYTTLRDLLSSNGLEPEEFVGIGKQYGIEVDDPIYEPTHDSKLNALLDSHVFQNIIKPKNEEAKRILREYLGSIEFMGRHRVAYMDATGCGRSQSSLERAFRGDKDFPFVYGYYLSTTKLEFNLEMVQVKGIISDWRRDRKEEARTFAIFGSLVEQLTHPNHGVTVGYTRRGDRVIPTFRKTLQPQYEVRSLILQGILSYARDYAAHYSLHNYSCEELLESEKKSIRQWVTFPPKRDVHALKDMISVNDWPREKRQPLIGHVKIVDLVRPMTFVRKVVTCTWPEGALSLAPVPGLNWLFYKTITYSSVIPKVNVFLWKYAEALRKV